MKQLTRNQIRSLTDGSKHWTEKKEHLIKTAKSYGLYILSDEDLQILMEEHIPSEEVRLLGEFMDKSKSGALRNSFTPTDVKGDFKEVTEPIIGRKYHVSWAYSGAVFVLVKMEGSICYLDNPRHKRKQYLKCKISELRHLR